MDFKFSIWVHIFIPILLVELKLFSLVSSGIYWNVSFVWYPVTNFKCWYHVNFEYFVFKLIFFLLDTSFSTCYFSLFKFQCLDQIKSLDLDQMNYTYIFKQKNQFDNFNFFKLVARWHNIFSLNSLSLL